MALSFETKTADGTTNTFTFSFGYLSTDDLHVYVNGVEDTTKTFPTASSYELTNMPEAGDKVTIQRTTDRSKLTVTIPNSGTFRGKDINAQSLQALYIAQEAYDALTGVIGQDVFDTTASDGQNRRIKNVADPIDDQDVATKKWSETSMTVNVAQAITARQGAEAAEATAVSAASTSTTKAGTATTQAGIATTQAGIATTKAADAAASAQSASNDKATVAADKATVASDKATVATDRQTVEDLLSNFVEGIPNATIVPVTPAGSIASTNVQAALQELDGEKVAKSGDTMTGRLDTIGLTYQKNITLAAGTDLNSIITAGFYDGSNLVNAPNTGWYHIEVRTHSGTNVPNDSNVFVFQIATILTASVPYSYMRSCSNGTWGGWYRVWNENSDGAGSGLDADLLDGQQGSAYCLKSEVANQVAAFPIGGVGTYLWGIASSMSSATPGTTVSGSLLSWGSINTSNFYRTSTPALAGTWMMCGYDGDGSATLFKRIA